MVYQIPLISKLFKLQWIWNLLHCVSCFKVGCLAWIWFMHNFYVRRPFHRFHLVSAYCELRLMKCKTFLISFIFSISSPKAPTEALKKENIIFILIIFTLFMYSVFSFSINININIYIVGYCIRCTLYCLLELFSLFLTLAYSTLCEFYSFFFDFPLPGFVPFCFSSSIDLEKEKLNQEWCQFVFRW